VHPLSFESLDTAVNWCEKRRLGLIAATRLAADTGLHEIAWKLAAAEMSFFYRRSHWAEWVDTHNIGLASARALGDRPAEAWMLNNLGMVYGVQGMEESIDCFEQALAISRELSDTWGEGRAIVNVANAYYRLRRFAEAQGAAERSLVIQRLAGNPYGEGIALGILGSSCEKLGDFSEAIDFLGQALMIFRELGEPVSLTTLLTAWNGRCRSGKGSVTVTVRPRHCTNWAKRNCVPGRGLGLANTSPMRWYCCRKSAIMPR
jgi:tetratricopeptide (TPR) repeat protein